ncbi:metallophosphoesterase family protein [Thermodesulfobacteriota bacterium]
MANRTIILLSDLHIGLRGIETTRTRNIFDKIAASYPGVPVLITGDLTDSASARQFRAMRKLLDGLAESNPILTVPGNHDYAWKGNILRDDGWENWVKHLGSPLGWGRKVVHWMGVDFEPSGIDGLGVWKSGGLTFFGIDSGDPKDKKISARGYISKRLADALNEVLKKYEGKTRVAMLHHHPFDENFFTKLHGADQLMNAVKNNCELLLFGHEHEYGIWWSQRGLPLTVSSHKSTDNISGNCLFITIIDILNAGTDKVSFKHRIETF